MASKVLQSEMRRGHLAQVAPSVVEVDVLLSQDASADARGQHVFKEAVQFQFGAHKGLAVALSQPCCKGIQHRCCRSMKGACQKNQKHSQSKHVIG